jgi:hypothetical protein
MLGEYCFELRSASFGEMHVDHPAVGCPRPVATLMVE